MAQASRGSIARRYAEAVFELALESGQSAALREELNSLSELLDENDEFREFIFSAAIHHSHKSEAIEHIFAERLSELAMNFLHVVIAKERSGLLFDIVEQYMVLDDAHVGRVHGVLVTAIELTDDDIAGFKEQIGKAIGKEVILQNRVDPTILGGSVLAIDEQIWDNSVRTNLHRFSEHLRAVGELKLSTT